VSVFDWPGGVVAGSGLVCPGGVSVLVCPGGVSVLVCPGGVAVLLCPGGVPVFVCPGGVSGFADCPLDPLFCPGGVDDLCPAGADDLALPGVTVLSDARALAFWLGRVLSLDAASPAVSLFVESLDVAVSSVLPA